MPIDNPQAISFSNERIRIAANLLAQLDNLAYSIINEWNARGGTAMIPNTSEIIMDGAETDGRPIITGINANNIINRLTALRATTANAGLAMGVAGVRDTVLQVATTPTRG